MNKGVMLLLAALALVHTLACAADTPDAACHVVCEALALVLLAETVVALLVAVGILPRRNSPQYFLLVPKLVVAVVTALAAHRVGAADLDARNPSA